MPSQLTLPSISDHLRAGKRQIIATQDEFADDRSGSAYDFLMGTAAMAWSREALADRDKFRAIYLTTAEGDDLTNFVLQRFGIPRILDTKGVGSCVFLRPTTAGGAGTIYAGTQIQVSSATGSSRTYEVISDVAVGASQLLASVPVQATTYGLGSAVNNASGTILDPLWDNSFIASALFCANGTVYESAAEFRARVTQTLLDQRPGYITLIRNTLFAAGANQVILFPSNYQGTDHGVNVAYVGDAGFMSTQTLLIACRVAVESCRVLGADLQIQGMTTTPLNITANVSLWNDPNKFDQNALLAQMASSIVQYFTDLRNAFAYKVKGIEGAAQRVSNAIQTVTLTSPSVDATFSSASFPATLARYMPSYSQLFTGITLTGPI